MGAFARHNAYPMGSVRVWMCVCVYVNDNVSCSSIMGVVSMRSESVRMGVMEGHTHTCNAQNKWQRRMDIATVGDQQIDQ